MQKYLNQPPFRRLALIQQWLLLLLLGAVVLLLVEIRFEHQAVMGEKWQAWIPLAYLGFMAICIPLGLLTLRSFGGKLLALVFGGLVVVGLCGFWFHAKATPLPAIQKVIKTITSQPGQLLQSDDDFSAPLLAPLSLVGLALMGILISLLNLDQLISLLNLDQSASSVSGTEGNEKGNL